MIFDSRRDANQSELPSITVGEVDGKPVVISLPPATNPKVPSTLYFTLPKAGTLMLTNLIKNLAPIVGSKLYYPIGELFKLGILVEAQVPASTGSLFLPRGYCYGLPYVPDFEIPILGHVKTILLVRDPRDMLVSAYYSLLFSHPNPGSLDGKPGEVFPGRTEAKNLDLDSFAANPATCDYPNRFRKVAELAKLPGVKVFRYEDIIYNKLQWAAEICDHFEWNIPRRHLEDAVAKVDVFPNQERPNDHVRQVHPGNYKTKLRPETIRQIEQHLAEEMAFFRLQARRELDLIPSAASACFVP